MRCPSSDAPNVRVDRAHLAAFLPNGVGFCHLFIAPVYRVVALAKILFLAPAIAPVDVAHSRRQDPSTISEERIQQSGSLTHTRARRRAGTVTRHHLLLILLIFFFFFFF